MSVAPQVVANLNWAAHRSSNKVTHHRRLDAPASTKLQSLPQTQVRAGCCWKRRVCTPFEVFILVEQLNPRTQKKNIFIYHQPIRCGVVGNIYGSHPCAPGSIPGSGISFFPCGAGVKRAFRSTKERLERLARAARHEAVEEAGHAHVPVVRHALLHPVARRHDVSATQHNTMSPNQDLGASR